MSKSVRIRALGEAQLPLESKQKPHLLWVLYIYCGLIIGHSGFVHAQAPLTTQRCALYLAASDLSRDGSLNKEPEFARFVTIVAGGPYATFAAVPVAYQTLYDQYATPDTGEISVDGAQAGSPPDAVTSLCSAVISTLEGSMLSNSDGSGTSTGAATTGPAPNSETSPPSMSTGASTGTSTGTVPVTAQAIPFTTCRISIAVSDSDRDNLLSEAEYTSFLNRLTTNQRGFTTFADLPANLREVFLSLSRAAALDGQIDVAGASPALFATATGAQKAYLETLCRNVQAALNGESLGENTDTQTPDPVVTTLPPASTLMPNPVVALPALPLAQCRISLAVADANRDKVVTQVEYIGFLNRLTGNAYLNTAFVSLPIELQTNFNVLAEVEMPSDSIDVVGSLPEEYGVATAEQKAFLQKICDDTQAITSGRLVGDTNSPDSPVQGVTASPSTTPPGLTLLSLSQCRPSMFVADANRDTMLNKEEYAVFVDRLVSTTAYANFESLTPLLRQTYDSLATTSDTGQINVYGATPAQLADSLQIEFLEKVCTNTQVAAAAGGTAAAETTVAPSSMASLTFPSPTPVEVSQLPTVSGPVVVPTYEPIDLIACSESVSVSDADGDGRINKTEYVDFLIQLSNKELFLTSAYESLPESLRANFQVLSDNNGVSLNIRGGNPGANNTVIADLYQTICDQTMVALNAVVHAIAIQDAMKPPTLSRSSMPSESYTVTPAPVPTAVPTVFDGMLIIYSSFIIYNPFGILADTLDTVGNPDRLDLERAYLRLAGDVVANNAFSLAVPTTARASSPETTPTSESGRQLSSIRGRDLLAFKDGSAMILDIEYRDCPQDLLDNALTEYCQTVYALYGIDDVASGTQESAYEYYTDLTQSSIDTGDLQSYLRDTNNSRLTVYGATDELVRWTDPPTQSPVRINNFPDEEAGINRTVLFVSLVGLLSLCALGVYFAWNDKDKIRERWREFKKKDKPKEEDAGGSHGDTLQGNEEVQYEIGEDGEIIYPEGYEEEDFEVEDYGDEFDVEQAGGKKKKVRPKKLLGKLGKGVVQVGKHARAFVNEHDMDMEEIEAIGFQDENLLDFEDYVFDTPAELLAEQATAHKIADEVVGKEGSAQKEDGRGNLAFAQSFLAGMRPEMSMASSASEMDDSDFSRDDFDDEYDSSNDSEVDEEESFDLDFSESDAGKGDGDSISTKDENVGDASLQDGDSLSSTEDLLPSALAGDGVDGTLLSAKANGGKSSVGGEDSDSIANDSNESGSDDSSWGSDTTTSSAEERMAEYRKEVKELVSSVIPEELDNLSTMMDQFEGREAELINTLQNMEERTNTQRARAAVHKTRVKVNPNQVGGYSIASEGSAVIAAASTLGPEPQRRQPRVQQDYYEDDYGSQDGSYYSDDYDSQEGSYYSDEYDLQEDSYYSGEESSYTEGEGSYMSEEVQSYTEGEGSYYDDEIPEGEEDSYDSQDKSNDFSQDGGSSYNSGEGSFNEDETAEGEEESYYSEDASNDFSQDEEAGYTDDEDSY